MLDDPPLHPDTSDWNVLIADEYITQHDDKFTVGPDEVGFYTFFWEGQGNPPDFMGIEDDQLLAIQNNLWDRFKARERAVFNKLHKVEQKHEFANTQFLKHFAQVSELLEPTAKDVQAKVKLADKILMLPSLFDGENQEKLRCTMKDSISILNFKPKKAT